MWKRDWLNARPSDFVFAALAAAWMAALANILGPRLAMLDFSVLLARCRHALPSSPSLAQDGCRSPGDP
jgi:hypothetical protein